MDSISVNQKRIISTWLYLEDVNENGIYPQVPGKSSTKRFHQIYKRCLLTFFMSARSANPNAELILFSNIDLWSSIDNFDVSLCRRLTELRVSTTILEYSFRPPREQKQWRNQFFVLNVLENLAGRISNDDLCLVLDADIVWSGNSFTESLWASLNSIGALNMLPITNAEESINGLSLTELRSFAEEVGFRVSQMSYSGGEFIALRGDLLRQVLDMALEVWRRYNDLLVVKNGDVRFLEEAHLLSMAYAALEIDFGTADIYIRRLWTQPIHYSNRLPGDIDLVCWHLPAEKRFGIRKVAKHFLNRISESWPAHGTDDWLKLVQELGIEKNSFSRVFQNLAISIRDRLVNRLRFDSLNKIRSRAFF